MKDYLYVFLHAPKTAGTTFNVHAEKNLSDEVALNYTNFDPQLNQNFKSQDYLDFKGIKNRVNKSLKALNDKDKEKYILFYNTHFAYYGVHKLFNKHGRYFTFVRNPARRVLSLYNYLSTLYLLEDDKGKKKRMYKDSLLVDGKYPKFEEWFSNKYGSGEMTLITMPMYKYFQLTGVLDKGKPTLAKIKSMYKKIFFVGTAKTFDEDSLYLYHLLGFDKFFFSQNKSIKYANQDEEQIQKAISKKFRPSLDIFEIGREENYKFRKSHPEFGDIVSEYKKKKFVKMPYTQLRYDPRGTLGLASSSLRKNVPYYSETLNYIKHNILK